jgi:hypothetical protein
VPLGGDAQLLVFDSANTSYKGFKAGDIRIDEVCRHVPQAGDAGSPRPP